MTQNKSLNSLLVPVDFSDGSREAFQWALDHVDRDDATIVLLHVIDEQLVDLIAGDGFAEKDDAVNRLRAQAEKRMREYAKTDSTIQVDTMISVGIPFLEIIRKADDFAVDAIVMSKVGMAGRFEKLLFGSTAEKVLRGSQRPVVVLAGKS
jgi:nucleotide-binding universal stress UspA family protein